MRGVYFTSLTVALCLATQSMADDVVEFFYSRELDHCYWGQASLAAENNTARGGLCAYVASIDRVYACPAQSPTCWAYAQTCEHGQDPGADQIYCSNHAQNAHWCCQDQETCTLNGHQTNVCVGGFDNPNANVDPADAEQELYSVIPSSKIVTTEPAQVTPSLFSTSTFATGSVSSSSTSSSTASSATPTTHSSGVSGGAIGGIVVGVLAGLAIICGTLIYVVVHRRRANRASVAAETKPNEKPLLTDEKYYLPPSSPQDRSSKQYAHQDNTYMAEVPSDAAFQGPTEMEGSRYNAPGTAPPHHELP